MADAINTWRWRAGDQPDLLMTVTSDGSVAVLAALRGDWPEILHCTALEGKRLPLASGALDLTESPAISQPILVHSGNGCGGTASGGQSAVQDSVVYVAFAVSQQIFLLDLQIKVGSKTSGPQTASSHWHRPPA